MIQLVMRDHSIPDEEENERIKQFRAPSQILLHLRQRKNPAYQALVERWLMSANTELHIDVQHGRVTHHWYKIEVRRNEGRVQALLRDLMQPGSNDGSAGSGIRAHWVNE